MLCYRCNSETRVIDSRNHMSGKSIRRRRECTNGHRFETYELRINPEKYVAKLQKDAARKKRMWDKMSPEERRAYKRREHRRAEARQEAAATGRPVAEIYEEWGVT